MTDDLRRKYWNGNLQIVAALLSVWTIVSFGCSIIFRDWMDANMPKVGNAEFGFWMAQQGSIITFVLILIAYAVLMNRLDEKHGFHEDDDEPEDDYLSHHPDVEAEIEAHAHEAEATADAQPEA